MEFLNGFACLVGGMFLREVLNELEIELCSVKGILICMIAAIICVEIINL